MMRMEVNRRGLFGPRFFFLGRFPISLFRLQVLSFPGVNLTMRLHLFWALPIYYGCVNVSPLSLFSGLEVCWMLTPRDQLLTSHDEFRKLVQEHSQYSQRLDSLTQKRYLSEDEKLEEVRLKKLKLRLKDQMESIERQFRQQYGVNVA
jgi:uncharacterized protein